MELVLDTSALMAILLDEPTAEACRDRLIAADTLLISAGTLSESLIVANARNCGPHLTQLLESLAVRTIPLGPTDAHLVAQAYQMWGKGFHPAALNFGDCFAYSLAKQRNQPLLFVGKDFGRTDVQSAL